MMQATRNGLILLAAIAAMCSQPATAAAPPPTLGTYDPPATINLNTPVCLAEGDFVSCSTSFLNYMSSIGAPNYGTTTPLGYVIDSNQGALLHFIVVGTGAGGQIPNNADFSTQIDRGYETPNNGNFQTSTATEPINGPTTGDSAVAWDMTLQSLVDALTIGGVRKDMIIGYDFNETGGVGQATNIWALLTIRDVDASNNLDPSAGLLDPINFELNGDPTNPLNFGPASNVYAFDTNKTFDGTNPTTPAALDFTYIAGDICVKPDGTFVPLFAPATTCPAGYDHLSNNLGTGRGEWISFVPELNSNLEALIAQGYDVLSAQFWVGCFYGSTFCNDGGYDDVFIMAGDFIPPVPEPATLALIGLGLLALLGFARRRKT